MQIEIDEESKKMLEKNLVQIDAGLKRLDELRISNDLIEKEHERITKEISKANTDEMLKVNTFNKPTL